MGYIVNVTLPGLGKSIVSACNPGNYAHVSSKTYVAFTSIYISSFCRRYVCGIGIFQNVLIIACGRKHSYGHHAALLSG